MLAHDVAFHLGHYDVDAMLDNGPWPQLWRWAAWLQIRGPQDGDRLDIAADRVAAVIANANRPAKAAPVELRWWHTETKPKLTPEQQAERTDDQIRTMVEIQAQRELNIQRGNELRAKQRA